MQRETIAVQAPIPLPPRRTPVGRPRTATAVAWREVLAQVGGMVVLLARVVRVALSRPLTWRRDCVEQSDELVRRVFVPLCLSVVAFGFGVIAVQAGLVLSALGSADRTGGLAVTGTVREVGAWLTAMVVGGVAGTAVCADLGARKTREELDALAVLGVDVVRALVVPRVLALFVMTPLLFLFAVLSCVVATLVGTTVLYGVSPGSFVATMQANFTTVELYAGVVKTCVFGVIIGVVSAYKGIHASGGPEGVGRAVNQAVVISFVVLWVFNYAFTSVLLATYPELLGLR